MNVVNDFKPIIFRHVSNVPQAEPATSGFDPTFACFQQPLVEKGGSKRTEIDVFIRTFKDLLKLRPVIRKGFSEIRCKSCFYKSKSRVAATNTECEGMNKLLLVTYI